MGTSDRVVGRPRTGCVARPFYCERTLLQLVNAIIANICSIIIHSILWTMEPSCIFRRICVSKMSRIGGAIRDRIDTGNDASRVNERERGRPSFLVLLNARDPTPGHSYLRLLRRKCLLPSAPRVRLRTLNRTSYESRNAMTDESAPDGGGCLYCPKRTGQTPAWSLPRK